MNKTDITLPIPESYWVIPGKLLAGEYPGHRNESETHLRLNTLLQAGMDAFIDLTRPGELAPYESILREAAKTTAMDVVYHRHPIGDFGLPTVEQMRSILKNIDGALKEGHKIYLHCWGGIGRTGTTVGCFLVHQGMSGSQALKQLNEWWQNVPKSKRFPHSPETDAQAKFILDWKD